MEIQNLTREFRYNGVRLPDPNPSFSLVQVRDFFAAAYPEIVSADIEGPEQVGAAQIYTFRRAVGTKGCGLLDPVDMADLTGDLAAVLQANWMLPGDRQFLNDVNEALRAVGPSAVSIEAQRRLVDLHREYCMAEAA